MYKSKKLLYNIYGKMFRFCIEAISFSDGRCLSVRLTDSVSAAYFSKVTGVDSGEKDTDRRK